MVLFKKGPVCMYACMHVHTCRCVYTHSCIHAYKVFDGPFQEGSSLFSFCLFLLLDILKKARHTPALNSTNHQFYKSSIHMPYDPSHAASDASSTQTLNSICYSLRSKPEAHKRTWNVFSYHRMYSLAGLNLKRTRSSLRARLLSRTHTRACSRAFAGITHEGPEDGLYPITDQAAAASTAAATTPPPARRHSHVVRFRRLLSTPSSLFEIEYLIQDVLCLELETQGIVYKIFIFIYALAGCRCRQDCVCICSHCAGR